MTEALDVIDWAMAAPLTPSLAFHERLSVSMHSLDIPMQERLSEHKPAFKLADMNDLRVASDRHEKHAIRSGLELDTYMERVASVWARRPEVPGTIRKVAAKARAKGIPMLSHDDT